MVSTKQSTLYTTQNILWKMFTAEQKKSDCFATSVYYTRKKVKAELRQAQTET